MPVDTSLGADLLVAVCEDLPMGGCATRPTALCPEYRMHIIYDTIRIHHRLSFSDPIASPQSSHEFLEVDQFRGVAQHVGSSSCRHPEHHLLGPECRRVWAVPERGAAEQGMRPAGQHANLHLGSLGDH